MDMSIIASTAITLLTSYLLKTGESVSQELGKSLWQKMQDKFKKEPTAKSALNVLEKEPDNKGKQVFICELLKTAMSQDEKFAQAVQKIVENLPKAPALPTINQVQNNFGVVGGSMVQRNSSVQSK